VSASLPAEKIPDKRKYVEKKCVAMLVCVSSGKNPNVGENPYVLKLEFAGKIPTLQDNQTIAETK